MPDITHLAKLHHIPEDQGMSMSMSRVWDLVAPMHLGLYKLALCAPCPIKGALKHY
jgi:hypothetical protein